jgi:hypothetical protein
MWAAACSSAVLGVGLCLPLWKRSYVSGYCVCYESVPIWRGLVDRRPVPPMEAKVTSEPNRNNCLALIAVAGGVGAYAYWVRRPRIRPVEADDYSEGPNGSGLDGRG